MNSQKPTTEQLDADLKAIEQELEKPEIPPEEAKTTEPEQEVVEETQEEAEVEETQEEAEVEETPEKTETTEEVKEPEETQEEKDYKKKFVDSTREATALASKNRKLNEAIESASSITDPSDEDLKKEFTDWDLMSDTEKRLAKKSYVADKRFEIIHQAAQEGKDVAVWNEKVDTFANDPKTLITHSDLEGKVDEFRIFASKQTRRGADLNDLVGAFLFQVEKSRPKHTGKMFETGSGGANEKAKPKSDKVSPDDAARLMATDYKKYKQLLIAGKIASE